MTDKKKLLEQELENTKNLQIDDDDDGENEISSHYRILMKKR